MIPDPDRLWAQCGMIHWATGNCQWRVVDWDSRRWITAEGPVQPFADEEGDVICRALLPFIDDLHPGITKVTLSATGEVINTSTDPDHDCTPVVNYPLFTQKEAGQDSLASIQRSQLKEINRLAICVDLVDTHTPTGSAGLLVFKYDFLQDNLGSLWKEAFLIRRLQACRHVVPFHNFVIDDVEPRFLGYTSKFISGGSLLETRRPFRKDWLLQLMKFVDDLNLMYGVVHQDIAPRNILLDPATDNLYVIDFGLAEFIGSDREYKPRNDIDGVIYTLYEILTHDETFRDDVNPEDYRVEDITSLQEWPLQSELEPGLDVPTLRSMVMEWAESRSRRGSPDHFELRNTLDFPQMPSTEVENGFPDDRSGEEAMTKHLVRWERMPWKKILPKPVE